MQNIVANQPKWLNVPVLMLMLAGAAVSMAAVTSGCGPNDVTIHQCVDAGMPDGGDAGNGGGGGDPLCK
jgi:hypothetical protein